MDPRYTFATVNGASGATLPLLGIDGAELLQLLNLVAAALAIVLGWWDRYQSKKG